MILCGSVCPYFGTRIRLLRASSTPLLDRERHLTRLPCRSRPRSSRRPRRPSAVNENRRPPLTTLATRLISITRSWRSRPEADCVSLRAHRAPDGSEPESAVSQLQSAFAGALGERPHAAVMAVSGRSNTDVSTPAAFGALGERGAGALRLLHRVEAAQPASSVHPTGQPSGRVVVDELGECPRFDRCTDSRGRCAVPRIFARTRRRCRARLYW